MRSKKSNVGFTEEAYKLLKRIDEKAEKPWDLSSFIQSRENIEKEELEKNPKIKRLKGYLITLHTLEGDFLCESRSSGENDKIHKCFSISRVCYEPNRKRFNLEINQDISCYIYLQINSNEKVETKYTRGYYSVFHICDVEEESMIAKFRTSYICNGEIYQAKYRCMLKYHCQYRDIQTGMCANTNNACGYKHLNG